MKLKSGKEEIVYLLSEVFKKYEQITGREVIRNTNRKNYEEIARELSIISNNLPYTATEKQHDEYPPERNPPKLGYPYLKYDITGGQIKDAYNGMVSSPRNFLVDSCYIYLFGVGRKGFIENPSDVNLLAESHLHSPSRRGLKPTKKRYNLAAIFFAVLFAVTASGWYLSSSQWTTIKKDLNILPYQPSKAEIDSLTGIWLVYIGSPQARSSDVNRYHMVANNLVDVKYKDGYFTFNRYGASFDHFGYMQFERQNLVSVHSYIQNGNGLESPRLSLLRLDQPGKNLRVISASWNFDVGSKNSIIGIREIYIKQGPGGDTQEIINTIENSSCKCKIVRWTYQKKTTIFDLKNRPLESLPDPSLRNLLDERSIILTEPDKGILLGPLSPGNSTNHTQHVR